MQTLFFVCCACTLVPCVALFWIYATNRTYPGFLQWSLASAAVFASTALLALRSLLPDEPTILLINLSFFVYPLLLARGFRQFTGRPPRNWILPVVLLVVTAIAVFFTYVHPDADIRVFSLSSLLVFLFADCAQLVRRVQSFAHPTTKAGLIAAFLLLTVWNLLRVPLSAGIGPGSHGVISPTNVAAATQIMLTSVNIWISLGVILLNLAKASESLRDSEERFRQAMEHSPIGMSLFSTDGRWFELNPALCHILGRSRAELIGMNFLDITHPNDRAKDRELIQRLLQREMPAYRREKRCLHPDGRVIWVQVDVSIIFHPDGTPEHLVSQVVDITERRKIDQALRDYQAKLVAAMDIARLGHWEYDVASSTFTFDENFYKLLGTTPAREGGMKMRADAYAQRFLFPEDATLVARELSAASVAPAPYRSRELEHRFRRADGSAGLISVRYYIERDDDGRPIRGFGLNQDITERSDAAQRQHLLEEQLRQAQKLEALGALAGGISHDFNNILTGIMGNLSLAEMELPGDHPVQVRLQEAGKASRRARDHIARILTFSRRYAGERAPASLGPIVQEAMHLLRASLPATIEIRTTIDPNCPRVVCDSTQIHQILMNLGTNAAHAMRSTTGILEVDLQAIVPDQALLDRYPQIEPDHRVRLRVRDNGCGMEQTVLDRIFEPFFTTKPPGEGTGLGLAMVHGIVADHSGAIVIDSKVGSGTTFDLYFPAAPGPVGGSNSPPPTPAPSGQEPPFGQGRKLMIVDDDLSILNLAKVVLTRSGFTVEPFSSPEAALARFQSAPEAFAAVVSDLTMPGMTGIDLANRLHSTRPDLPIILASGYLPPVARTGAAQSGITHFVSKPFELSELLAKLRLALAPEKSA